MKFQLNLLVAWFWIMFGFLSGMLLGMFFHQENWLGGYGSFRRRLYRLGHISFFGLGALNLLFFLTAQYAPVTDRSLLTLASWLFAVGAFSMPVCCLVMAHCPKLRLIFVLPVSSLIGGGAITLLEATKL